MNFQYPIHYGAFTPCAAGGPRRPRRRGCRPPPPNPNCPPGMENGFEKDFAVVWPAPGIGDMQGGIGRTRMPAQNLNHFTATTGPAIVRGDALPADLKGDLLFTEPVGPSDPARGDREHRRAHAAAQRLSGRGVHHEHRPAVPAGEHQQRPGRHGLHRRHVPRHHPGAGVVGPGIVPAREDRAVSAGQGRGARPHLAAALRRPGRRAGDRHEHRAGGDSGDRADVRAAGDVQRDAGAARRALHASERLVARHRAAAAGPEAGQVGRAGAAADGARRAGEPRPDETLSWRDSTRCGRSKGSARSTPRSCARR